MSRYNFNEIERKWQAKWAEEGLYKTPNDPSRPKYYVLDMFPYPSGNGLHVGHPLGYIASDIVARYKRLNGFNVLHPIGYDAFGLPAEQYAIQTGQHPAITTEANIKRFREQLDRIGFSFDWSRQVKTSDPDYYKWTQWIFGLFFTHWFNTESNKAEPIEKLIGIFANSGNAGVTAHTSYEGIFSAADWNAFSHAQKNNVLNGYRLAFQDETTVNWCAELGTVLANEEVVNGKSERGGYPVVRKKMQQWSLRITAYADRLISGLDTLQWSDAIKEIQRNWIGKSVGAELDFLIKNDSKNIRIFTTRPDTIFGATFMVLAPEYEGLEAICSADKKAEVMAYAENAKNRAELDRISDTKKTGVFTGSFAINPFTQKEMQIWVSDYVLGGYGTGAIMGVPAHDDRDFEFASAFDQPIVPVIQQGNEAIELPMKEAFSAKEGVCINSDFLNGLEVKHAIARATEEIVARGLGNKKINYRLRDAGFGRQRYWGEPFPVIFDAENVPQLVHELPVVLPEVEKYTPTGTGESPLAAVTNWVSTLEGRRETNTMPGWAGSSWYFLRYMDPHNGEEFAGKEALNYWKQVDLYVGGSEHATGHLLYARFWTKFLHDLGFISWDEPFQKLINQGMILGEDGQKMSKRWGNVVNPDDVCDTYGADTLRIYEMFLGPLTDAKPWNTNGIEGSARFLGKFWKLFYKEEVLKISEEKATPEELKVLHRTIKKVGSDIEQVNFNTSISAFMVCTNELQALGCNKREILEPLLVILAPFAPHIAEEIWQQLGHDSSVHRAQWPKWDASILLENTFTYPVSVNGKTRTSIEFPLDLSQEEVQQKVLADEVVQKWVNGNELKKFVFVKGRIINLVV